MARRRAAIFTDYDGTLTPIVSRPEAATVPADMKRILTDLARSCTVAVISGRDLDDVRGMIGLDELIYVGSHGFDIAGPAGMHIEHEQGTRFLPVLDEAERELTGAFSSVAGVQLERKKYAIAIHYRNADPGAAATVEAAVDRALRHRESLRKRSGKKIFELQPAVDWDKGKAIAWLLERLGLDEPDVLPFYLGDDTTDEDAFRALRDRGVTVVVAAKDRPTDARYRLRDPAEVRAFLARLAGATRE